MIFQRIQKFNLKKKIDLLKHEIQNIQGERLKEDLSNFLKRDIATTSYNNQEDDNNTEGNLQFVCNIKSINYQRWYVKITMVLKNDFHLVTITLFDNGADQNCLQEGLIPSKYYKKTTERLNSVNGSKLIINYKLPKAKICNQGYCFKTQFILVKNLNSSAIIGTPFITTLYPFRVSEKGIETNILEKKILFEF